MVSLCPVDRTRVRLFDVGIEFQRWPQADPVGVGKRTFGLGELSARRQLSTSADREQPHADAPRWDEESDEDKKKRWSNKIKEFVDEYERILPPIFAGRVNAWHASHSDEPKPITVTLFMRRFHVNDVDAERYWEGPFESPIGVFGLESGAFIERYDPVVGRMTKASP
ncbi:MAG: hypothetical protein U0744_03680 [Gemmataceae bacterium]